MSSMPNAPCSPGQTVATIGTSLEGFFEDETGSILFSRLRGQGVPDTVQARPLHDYYKDVSLFER